MTTTFRQLHLALIALLLGSAATAQFTVTSGLTLEEYVNDVLLGDGVEAFNITLTGLPDQIGHMQNAPNPPAQIADGVILSTAFATNVTSTATTDVFGGVSGDPDLLSVAQSVPPLIGQNFNVSSVNDICALEFDFVATGDSIKFNYFFGSNEYLTWVNTQYNDVFAFFLSGPGITGPFGAPAGFPDGAINIAILPDTDPPLPITISSVNNNLNSQFYINNQPNVGFFQNGLTTMLTAEAGGLICGETYHIKLAIADGTDTVLESVVVIEAGSFSSNDVFIEASIPNAPDDWQEFTLLEGCIDGLISIFRPNTNVADTVFLTVGGTATPGEDYIPLPEFVVFEEGESIVEIDVITLFDGIEEGPETITVTYEYTNLCDEETVVSIELTIIDYFLPELDLPDQLLLCNDETAVLSAIPTGGFAPFNYEWSTGQSSSTITVGESGSELITVTVTDYCESEVSDTVDVLVPDQNLVDWEFEQVNAPDGFPENTLLEGCVDGIITISRVNTTGTDTVNLVIGGSASMGSDYEAFDTELVYAPGQESIQIDINTIFDGVGEGTETIEITYIYIDGCDIEYTETIILDLWDYTTPQLDLPDVLFLCEGETQVVSAEPEEGYPPFNYVWSTEETTESITVTGGDGAIFVEVTDYCGSEVSGDFLIDIPDPLFFPDDAQICLGGSIGLQPIGGEPPYTFEYPTDSLVLENAEFTPLQMGSYTIEYIDACGVSGTSVLNVIVCETSIPNIFSPNNDGVNDVFLIQGNEGFPNSRFEVYNRWGALVYESDNYRNNWRGDDLAEGVYYYIYLRSDGEKFAGHLTLVRTTRPRR